MPSFCDCGRAQRGLFSRVTRARAARDEMHVLASTPLYSPLPHLADAKLLRLSAGEVLACLAAGPRMLTSSQLLSAYERRVAATWRLNAVSAELSVSAREAAAASDARRARGGTARLLEGLPISVKDHIEQAGVDCGGGQARYSCAPAARTSPLVAALERAGAVPFVRTQVPQLLMLPETDNLVFGRALNPWAAERTPGGSSGGEAALIAACASCAGIGTDIGGSLRIPAHMCGIVAFKPTPGRLTALGMRPPFAGQNTIRPTAGPMARCVADAELLMRAWLQPFDGVQGADLSLAPLPWSEAAAAASPKRLRVGVMTDDGGFFPAAEPCVRAVREAAAAAAAAGHDVVPFDVREAGVDLYDCCLLYYSIMSADGGMASFVAALRGESLLPLYAKLKAIASIPNWVRPAAAFLLRALGRPREADLIAAARKRSVEELWALNARADAAKRAYYDAWKAAGLDVLIAPGLGLPAFPHGAAAELTPACSYAFLFNLLDMPAGALPVTRVRLGEDVYLPRPQHRDDIGAAAVSAAAGSAGLPVGVQVVALPFKDELAIRFMRELEGLLRNADASRGAAGGGVPESTLAATLAAAAAAARDD